MRQYGICENNGPYCIKVRFDVYGSLVEARRQCSWVVAVTNMAIRGLEFVISRRMLRRVEI